MTRPSPHLHLLMSRRYDAWSTATSRDAQKNIKIDRHINHEISITSTALKQQPTWASDCAVVQSTRERPSIDRRRRTVDCCMVAFVICLWFVTHRRFQIHPPGLICCKIASPSLIVYPANRLWYDSRARLCLMVVLEGKCEYYYAIYYEKCHYFAAWTHAFPVLFSAITPAQSVKEYK